MSAKLHHHCFLSPSTCTRLSVLNPNKVQILYKVIDLDQTDCAVIGKTFLKCTELENRSYRISCRYRMVRKHTLFSNKIKRAGNIIQFASADDGIKVNGNSEANMSRDVEAMRMRLDQALKNEDYNDGLVQSLYDAARVFELSIKEQSSLWKIPWFSAAWLGVDKNAWAKELSYQASVYALLQAAHEVSSRGDGGDKEVNAVVQRSLLRLSAPLESLIREKLSGKQPQLFEWFWSEQIPVVVTTFVNHFERDPRFKAATMFGKRMPSGSGNAGDMSLIVLALVCSSVIMKLGSAKVSCSQFFSIIPDVTGTLMDVLVGLVPIHEAYHTAKEIGLQREFLVHFGPRAAACGVNDDCSIDEMIFWVDLVQKQLQRAIDREKIWSKLTTSESIEVLEKDLAIFGFFVALGRSTRSFLAANGYDKIDEPVECFIRYFVSGCVLYYPQLSPISSYELYVEVVCEELDWLPFYPGYSNTLKNTHGHEKKSDSPPNPEAVQKALDVCSRWTRVFIKHSKWVENPSNVKAARFLSKGLNTLGSSMEELGLLKSKSDNSVQSTGPVSTFNSRREPDSFNKALENVEEALVKLEKLLQEMHVSSSGSGKEQLKAACSDLEKIRKLKKEAEFLEASFRAKAACLQEVMNVLCVCLGAYVSLCTSLYPCIMFMIYRADQHENYFSPISTRSSPRGLWAFLVRPPMKMSSSESLKAENITRKATLSLKPLKTRHVSRVKESVLDRKCVFEFCLSVMQEDTSLSNLQSADSEESDTSEIHRFELLRSELIELEKRVKKSTNQSESEEDIECVNIVRGSELVPVQKNGSLIEKSLEKLKETSTDVWQGTQLLAIDTAAASGLLRRAIIGDELTDKEKKFFRRTLTDLASVVPIGVLMLLPVTAVGHAAMLAAIQRYVPALIPSTYGSERLQLLRQLEKMKQTESGDAKLKDNVDESAQR
ncbi:hypothetical protein KSS87_014836 [Heliosperma pusillum]|nr:hypothetical protein KSS87_014836 [Heliosperma pusillum]